MSNASDFATFEPCGDENRHRVWFIMVPLAPLRAP